ncbi:MAG TPA: DUF1993 domain-containing protein [Caulobacterales bacterium]|jgi:hypothetical protein|nr:DUF1993 domain-containing protein [Caulobacterales bacterium]
MSLSLYEISVPVYRQFLTALVGVLDKGEKFCAEKGLAPADVFATRLFDDMQPFTFQVMQAINHSVGALALVRGQQRPRPEGLTSFEAMKSAVQAALAELDAIKPADLAGAETKTVELKFPGREMKFTGLGYLQSFAMPQFFFHATTAYDILRHKGVPVGKRDFLGQVALLNAAPAA